MTVNQQEFAFYLKAKNAAVRKRLGILGGFFWCSGAKEKVVISRCVLAIDEAGFDEEDFARPVRVNLPVVGELPDEGVFDVAFCNSYEPGGEDGKTMMLIPGVAAENVTDSDDTGAVGAAGIVTKDTATFEQKILGSWLFGSFETLDYEQVGEIEQLQADSDAEYARNVLLVANDFEHRQLRHAFPETVFGFINDIKSVWPADKNPELSLILSFSNEWLAAHNNNASGGLGENPMRKDITDKWVAKFNGKIKRTDTGTNAGGENKTDRNPDYAHTLDTLDQEIALATLPVEFDIYDIPGSVHRNAKKIISDKESPWKEWSAVLRSKAGILDYSRAAIFALIRSAHPGIHNDSVKLSEYINSNLTEFVHDKPSAETLQAAHEIPKSSERDVANDKPAAQSLELGDFAVAPMRLALRVIAQFISDKPAHMINQAQRLKVGEMALDTDDGYIQNLILAARNVPDVETMDIPALWRLIDAVKQVFPTDKRTELAVLINFLKIWLATAHGSRKEIVTAWAEGRRITEVKPEPTTSQPETISAGDEVSSTDAMEVADSIKDEIGNVQNVQIQETVGDEEQISDAVSPSESGLVTGEEADPVKEKQSSEETETQPEPETVAAPEWPEIFEPGRYEGLPNEVYHAANGISSTMVKDARVSLMYFDARHVKKTIQKARSPVLDMGNLVHALALQPGDLDKEFSVEPIIPDGAYTTTATIRAFIDEHNASLPALLSADDIKALLEAHNATLPAQVPQGAGVEETGQSYMSLPAEFQRIEDGQKQTASAMKACIKEYNATLPAQVKTSGSRDALLEQLALVNPDMVAQEAQKPQPLKVSGTKADLMQSVKSVKPDAVFADELMDAWRENPEGKVLVTRQQLATALDIQKALLNHPTAGKLLTHPSRAVEVSYFGIDEETGLDIRVRPDLEIEMDGLRIGADLKTISMWNIKQEGLRAKLHREIIDRDYHLSAAMYCATAELDQFFWIFVNKDENYHWIAIIEASAELLELGMLEYHKAMRAIANGFDTGEWPAPITEDYAEELNDFDVRRLEALRGQA